jgi:hypothetical protein
MATLKIEFFTTTFERNHGKKPKGTGRWAFIVMDGNREHETVFVPRSMTLGEAKSWMRDYCRQHYSFLAARGVILEVEVAP